MTAPHRLLRVVIKQELVELTGNWLDALILNQFLYWIKVARDMDKFIDEERQRHKHLDIEPTQGWIYKSAKELAGELMTGASDTTILRHIDALLEAGYLTRRRNPKYKWDRTWQYRPDILKIQTDLQALGYALEGYPLLMQDASNKTLNPNVQNVDALPEITTEITTEEERADALFFGPDGKQEREPVKADLPETTDPNVLIAHCANKSNGRKSWTVPEPAPKANGKTPAVLEFKRATGYMPPVPWRDEISERVGTKPADLKRWYDTCYDWVGCGWNPRNAKGMLDVYIEGRVQSTGPPDAPQPAIVFVEPAWMKE